MISIVRISGHIFGPGVVGFGRTAMAGSAARNFVRHFSASRGLAAAAPSSRDIAHKLLAVGELKPGDALVQNDADSEIGKAVIRLARQQQIKTINIISDKPGALDRVEDLKELGGDIVVTEAYTKTWHMNRLLSDFAKPSLGINYSEASAATTVARLVAQGGTLVTHGTELPQRVVYPGATRRPFSWSQLLKGKKLQAETL